MKARLTVSIFLLLLLWQNSMAKEWRGIIPLKSTQGDVERRFGKPNKWGNYDFKNERVSFEYGDEPCRDLYLALGKDNCKCLADKGAVMSIFVEPTDIRKISDLKLDMKKFTRTAINPFPYTFEYDNVTEGITYTVDEQEDEIRTVTYYPSPVDCQDIISKRAPIYRNSWRGLIPLHATRRAVEQLLGPPQHVNGTSAVYGTDHETISVQYSKDHCAVRGSEWNVPSNTMIELVIGQRLPFLVSRLNLDANRYVREEQRPVPEHPNSLKVVNYVDRMAGIVIRAQSIEGGPEEVISITYLPAARDTALRCHIDLKVSKPN